MAATLQTSQSRRHTDHPDPADTDTDELLELFGDEYTRRVFEAVTGEARSGRSVAEEADVSRPTAYRRLNDLRDAGLVRTEMMISEDGHHREKFEAVAETLSVSLGGDHIEAQVCVAD
jgi:DNA-binding transcriptional ArsR family regulator